MHVYRTLQPFHAITLDLDNTLYDNYPVINRAEEKSILFLQQYHPALSKIQNRDYYQSRKMLQFIEPNICHDVNYWRWKSLKIILLQSGLTKNEAQLGADYAMEIIIHWRNKIDISLSTHNVLSALSSKWPLIAITNGNANPISCGLQQYFQDVLRAGINGRAKPYKDMYYLASKRFGISCKNILHVGDDLNTDIKGAIHAGMQACWISQYNLNQFYSIDATLLPHLKISKLTSLTYLL
ncbi:5-amino-6-(5-phospho-D-ribitylamino)uracil phosphatase YigB [Candidatus Blochmanniella camponoti]|uniref:5-amino-6-(5-phospho-D-ribitylamino)uracil phosphatase YigB n=1 Tax=Candidatus Blochmanniella camponoti TaxID=108080 RepID=A0AAE9L6B4_9ENTR|nr:5-amino-6-(5-phospho-D-ribitylamino)uracil phosphatase YigB [Candidatus Blochmannia herculeanus]URJ24404.1 5-amino-6-(5-phospho-D-ribitylamino)uracil phosphatase YigB [Candidatus Blochmannia herculeanus]URJ26986.1 5-amino-6-(5-phospho-D-ribitylamino)uracil phosphatase YigB [Candidatus Blochmannia herculeanus]URJ27759.1 5-amino-6-(5-phospho-D-ribitylamino)uracil phosphatase YigB [Candidatus Blochmannia herculeanus]